VVEATLAYLRQGGWVMLPLVAVSLAMWTLILERWHTLRALGRGGLHARLETSFQAARSGRAPLDREILAQCAGRLDRELESRHAVIAVLAAVAPLLGLLGTVIGMVETFQVIAWFGTGNARALAGGVSVALVTTQTGLLVAIPGLVLSGRLRDRADQLRNLLAETAAALDRSLGPGGAS